MKQFQILLEWDSDDDVWVTYVPALDHLSSYGDTREEALRHTREAILGYLEAAEREGLTVSSDHHVELVELDLAI